MARRPLTWHAVLVQRDVHKVQQRLHARAVDARWLQVDQHQVVIGAAGHDVVAQLLHALAQCLAVGDDLLLVLDELGGVGHLEGHRQGADGVVVRAALREEWEKESRALLHCFYAVVKGHGIIITLWGQKGEGCC